MERSRHRAGGAQNGQHRHCLLGREFLLCCMALVRQPATCAAADSDKRLRNWRLGQGSATCECFARRTDRQLCVNSEHTGTTPARKSNRRDAKSAEKARFFASGAARCYHAPLARNRAIWCARRLKACLGGEQAVALPPDEGVCAGACRSGHDGRELRAAPLGGSGKVRRAGGSELRKGLTNQRGRNRMPS